MGDQVLSTRTVDRLRLSVTDRCDLRCTYCMPPCGVTKVARESVLTIEEMAHAASILAGRFGIRSVRLTGGEPLLRAGLGRLVSLLAGLDLEDLALTTNAQRLAAVARDLRGQGLARVNVSLDTLDGARFRDLTMGGDLRLTLEGIDAAIDAGLLPVKLNTVVMRGVNEDEVVDIARFGLERGCEVRFLELMPIGVAREPHDGLFVPAARVLGRLGRAFRLEPLPAEPGGTARVHLASDGEVRGRIGIISPETEPFCETCGRLRLTTDGRLLGCLHAEEGVELRPLIRAEGGPDDEAIALAVQEAIRRKPLCRQGSRKSPMHVIGG